MPDGIDYRNHWRYGTVENTYAAVCIAALTFVDINYLWVVLPRVLLIHVSKVFVLHDVNI